MTNQTTTREKLETALTGSHLTEEQKQKRAARMARRAADDRRPRSRVTMRAAKRVADILG